MNKVCLLCDTWVYKALPLQACVDAVWMLSVMKVCRRWRAMYDGWTHVGGLFVDPVCMQRNGVHNAVQLLYRMDMRGHAAAMWMLCKMEYCTLLCGCCVTLHMPRGCGVIMLSSRLDLRNAVSVIPGGMRHCR